MLFLACDAVGIISGIAQLTLVGCIFRWNRKAKYIVSETDINEPNHRYYGTNESSDFFYSLDDSDEIRQSQFNFHAQHADLYDSHNVAILISNSKHNKPQALIPNQCQNSRGKTYQLFSNTSQKTSYNQKYESLTSNVNYVQHARNNGRLKGSSEPEIQFHSQCYIEEFTPDPHVYQNNCSKEVASDHDHISNATESVGNSLLTDEVDVLSD